MGLFNWNLDLSTKRSRFFSHFYLFYHVILKKSTYGGYYDSRSSSVAKTGHAGKKLSVTIFKPGLHNRENYHFANLFLSLHPFRPKGEILSNLETDLKRLLFELMVKYAY